MARYNTCPNCGRQMPATVHWCYACSRWVPPCWTGSLMVVGIIGSSIALLACLRQGLSLLQANGDPLGVLPFTVIRMSLLAGLICWIGVCLALRSRWPRAKKIRAVRAGFEIALGGCAVFLCLMRALSGGGGRYPHDWPELGCLWATGLVLLIIGIRAVSADERG